MAAQPPPPGRTRLYVRTGPKRKLDPTKRQMAMELAGMKLVGVDGDPRERIFNNVIMWAQRYIDGGP